jgi:hypothetical protein
MIAIELCRILQTTTSTKVSSIILIDTPNTQHWMTMAPEVAKYEPEVTSSSAMLRQGVKRRFEAAQALVNHWRFPSESELKRPGPDSPLSTEVCGYRAFPVSARGYPTSGGGGIGLARLKFDRDFIKGLQMQHSKGLLPPTMLLRAVEAVPTSSANGGLPYRIDLDRTSRVLGWEQHSIDFIRVVQDTPGNHYDMFEGAEQVNMPKTHRCPAGA